MYAVALSISSSVILGAVFSPNLGLTRLILKKPFIAASSSVKSTSPSSDSSTNEMKACTSASDSSMSSRSMAMASSPWLSDPSPPESYLRAKQHS